MTTTECGFCKRDCPPEPTELGFKNPEAFSRHHWTSSALDSSRMDKDARESEWRETMATNRAERAERSPKAQLAVLDSRLGKNVGAKKERARLIEQVHGKLDKPAKKKRKRKKSHA